ncbi:MAG: Twin-arginine translocation pathway signal [Belnapia sp.]|nr:Twin-arginine translocation pathway signal [Belnapia sp.]
MQRRNLLVGALAPAVLAPLAPARAVNGIPAPRRLVLRHATTGARFSGSYHDGRAIDPAAMADISAVLADSRTGTVHAFDPTVLDILWETGQRARMRGEFLVVSGFRTPATNAAVCGAGNSQHLRAGAIDVCVAATQLATFGSAALALRRGGVGLYASQGFVHLDSGPVRQWGGGTPASTGPAAVNPADDRLNRLAEAWAATRQP